MTVYSQPVGIPTLSEHEALERLSSIPGFPPVVRKLMSMIAAEATNLRALSDLLQSDAVLAGESLRLANSAVFSLRSEVTSILHAVSVLGLDRLKSVVLTVGLRALLHGESRSMRNCWRHNLACAVVAEYAAEACGLERTTAYTAGLLHGIGQLALASRFPAEWEVAVAEAHEGGGNLLHAETRHIGVHHMHAAAYLMHHWGLPESLLPTSRCNHYWPDPIAGPMTLPRLVELACAASDSLGFPVGQSSATWDGPAFLEHLPEPAQQRLCCSVDSLAEMVPYKINGFETTLLR